MITKSDLRNLLARLHHLDRADLVGAGVFGPGDVVLWEKFRQSPVKFFMNCPTVMSDAIWTLLEGPARPLSITESARVMDRGCLELAYRVASFEPAEREAALQRGLRMIEASVRGKLAQTPEEAERFYQEMLAEAAL
jgi:hypothetical protein